MSPPPPRYPNLFKAPGALKSDSTVAIFLGILMESLFSHRKTPQPPDFQRTFSGPARGLPELGGSSTAQPRLKEVL